MTRFPRKLASVVLLASLFISAGGAVWPAQLRHLVCAHEHHNCGAVVVGVPCCCGQDGEVTAPLATPTDRDNDAIAVPPADAAAVQWHTDLTVSDRARLSADTCLTLQHAPDRPILFSDLRL